MKKLKIIALSAFMLGTFPSPSKALIPSTDILSTGMQVVEGVQTVMQYLNITDATKTISQVNTLYGSAKSSISGYMGNKNERLLARIEEVKKEKEVLEGQKEKFANYEKYQAQLQSELDALQSVHAESMKNYEDTVAENINAVKEKAAAEAAEQKQINLGITAAIRENEGPVTTIDSYKETVLEEEIITQTREHTVNITAPVENTVTKEVTITATPLDEIKAASSTYRNPLGAADPVAVPDQVLSNSQTINSLVASPEESATGAASNSLSAVKDVLANTSSAVSKAVSKIKEQGVPANSRISSPDLANPSKNFRQRPALNPINTTLEKRSDYKFVETMAFASAISIPESPMPTVGGTYRNTFIFSDELAKYCDISVADLNDKEKMKECQVKLVSCMFHKNNDTAKGCKDLYSEILHETVLAATAESLDKKQTAAAYSRQVIDVIIDDMTNATTIRDDINNLAMMNKEIVTLLNYMVELYAGQIAVDNLARLSSFDRRIINDTSDEIEEQTKDNSI